MSVLIKKDTLIDISRSGRKVPFKLYYRAEQPQNSVPLIIWSHGFGGNQDGAAFLSRHLAAHGYVVVHPTHIGTDSSLWEGKPGHPWDILKEVKISRETSLNRFLDIPFLLDTLPGWLTQYPDIGPVDFNRIGMSGHSFGAMTTQVMAGQAFPGLDNRLIRMAEPRFKAGILYSPVPIPHLSNAPPEDLYGPIELPLLHMTGTEDASPLEHFSYRERLAVFEHTGHPEKYLLVKDGGDHMVYNGTRGKLEKNPLREPHEEIIKTAALAYWNAMLKGDETAKRWLAEDAAAWMSGRGLFQDK